MTEKTTSLDTLKGGSYAPNINVRGEVVSVSREPFYCAGGSQDAAMGFQIRDPSSGAQQKVFVFADHDSRLPKVGRGDVVDIRGATYSHDTRFGSEIRASPHTGGHWSVDSSSNTSYSRNSHGGYGSSQRNYDSGYGRSSQGGYY